MKLNVYSSKGSKTKKSVDLDDAVFGIEPNDHAIYLDVKRFLAAQRQGPHASARCRARLQQQQGAFEVSASVP